MAISAAANLAFNRVASLFPVLHLFVAEAAYQFVEVSVRESEEHGGGEPFEVLGDPFMELWGELHERGHICVGARRGRVVLKWMRLHFVGG